MPQTGLQRVLFITALILAGEAIFTLPFHVARFFRPTVLEVFSLTATELGAAQGVYGITAMFAYFFGGPIADRFPASKLLASSLWLTAFGGIYMSTFPSAGESLILWGFFGISTILLFWAALIRATRDWGGENAQGRAYGLLDGGRGLLASVLATMGVLMFGMAFPEGYGTATFMQKQDALRMIIYTYVAVTVIAGVFVWFALPSSEASSGNANPPLELSATGLGPWHQIKQVMSIPAVWLQAIVIFCAYVAYKGFDNYSLFAVQAYGIDEVEAAKLVAAASWMRPLAALAAGLIGDKLSISRMTFIAFLMLLASHLFFALTTPIQGASGILLTNMILGAAAFFGLRGLYFALFEECRVPMALTGSAVGFVSVLGYTPDIFVAYVAGLLIDQSPGLEGHQNFFLFLSVFSMLGLVASYSLMRLLRR
jgi:nitrate/nitrite transporter NarK